MALENLDSFMKYHSFLKYTFFLVTYTISVQFEYPFVEVFHTL